MSNLTNKTSSRISQVILNNFKKDTERLSILVGKKLDYLEKINKLSSNFIDNFSTEEQKKIVQALSSFINYGRKERGIKKLNFLSTLNKLSINAIPLAKHPAMQSNLQVMFEKFLYEKGLSDVAITSTMRFYNVGIRGDYDELKYKTKANYIYYINLILEFSDSVIKKDNTILYLEYMRNINRLTDKLPIA